MGNVRKLGWVLGLLVMVGCSTPTTSNVDEADAEVAGAVDAQARADAVTVVADARAQVPDARLPADAAPVAVDAAAVACGAGSCPCGHAGFLACGTASAPVCITGEPVITCPSRPAACWVVPAGEARDGQAFGWLTYDPDGPGLTDPIRIQYCAGRLNGVRCGGDSLCHDVP